MESIKCLVKASHSLAESPLWNKWRNSIVYIDINDQMVHEYKLEDQSLQSIKFDAMVGTVLLVDEVFIIATEANRLVKVNLDTHEKEYLIEVPMAVDMRINDGKCDETGRVFVGSILSERDVEKRFEKGSFYSIETTGEIKVHQDKLTISNGMAWNVAEQLMYFTDTYTQAIKTYKYDKLTGGMEYKEIAVNIPKEMGGPDGFTIDVEGMLWIALFGGHAVIRVNPSTGEIISRIDVPNKNVTCCIFGGEQLDTLYITTAGDENSKGGLYEFKTSTRGYDTNTCCGEWL